MQISKNLICFYDYDDSYLALRRYLIIPDAQQGPTESSLFKN